MGTTASSPGAAPTASARSPMARRRRSPGSRSAITPSGYATASCAPTGQTRSPAESNLPLCPVPVAGPVAQLRHHRLQGVTLVRELVAHAHPAARLDLALDQAGLLELLEAAGEQAIRHAGNGFLQLAEMEWALGERVEDRSRPAAADQLHRTVVMPTDLF